MINFTPKMEDAIYLAFLLKKNLGYKVQFTPCVFKEILQGKIIFENSKYTFFAKYSRGEFLRLTITGNDSLAKKRRALFYMRHSIKEELDTEGNLIGDPLAYFEADDLNGTDPFLEWAFVNKEEYREALENGTLIEDADIRINWFYDKNPLFQKKK